jgi:hypothetical protein
VPETCLPATALFFLKSDIVIRLVKRRFSTRAAKFEGCGIVSTVPVAEIRLTSAVERLFCAWYGKLFCDRTVSAHMAKKLVPAMKQALKIS